MRQTTALEKQERMAREFDAWILEVSNNFVADEEKRAAGDTMPL